MDTHGVANYKVLQSTHTGPGQQPPRAHMAHSTKEHVRLYELECKKRALVSVLFRNVRDANKRTNAMVADTNSAHALQGLHKFTHDLDMHDAFFSDAWCRILDKFGERTTDKWQVAFGSHPLLEGANGWKKGWDTTLIEVEREFRFDDKIVALRKTWGCGTGTEHTVCGGDTTSSNKRKR